MANNFVTSVPIDLLIPSSLNSIDLSFNYFEDEVYLPKDFLSISSVLMNSNKITGFNKLLEEGAKNALINYIDLSGNPLLLKSENLTSLDIISQSTTVVLNNCQLSNFPTGLFRSNSNIQNLFLDQNNFINLNEVSNINFGKSLKRLSLKYLDFLVEVS